MCRVDLCIALECERVDIARALDFIRFGCRFEHPARSLEGRKQLWLEFLVTVMAPLITAGKLMTTESTYMKGIVTTLMFTGSTMATMTPSVLDASTPR